MKTQFKRKWLAPEVVQTSVMDCGPAALKCLLDGYGIPSSFARLRDACQTSVDGTSIDELETVAQRLGLQAEQLMLPADFLWIPEAKALPALAVVQLPHGPTHFIILWRQLGPWVQVMDPGVGRRWLRKARLQNELLEHRIEVPAEEWLAWATCDDTLAIFRWRLTHIGVKAEQAEHILLQQVATHRWQTMARLDAALRMLFDLKKAGGLGSGAANTRLLNLLLNDADDKPSHLPDRYWSVTAADAEHESPNVMLRGAVLLRVSERLEQPLAALETEAETAAEAVQESPAQPARELWRLVRAGGLVTPLALAGVVGLAMGALIIEALLFRGLFEIARDLNMVSQRSFALFGLLLFVLLVWAFELPVISKSLQLGRHLETRLRIRLLEKLPLLSDRFFQSRPVSDMAERGHSLYLLRSLPELVINFLRVMWELLFTLLGIAWIAPASAGWALAVAAVAVAFSLLAQPVMSERDLRVRSHFGAMQGFYLDALLGSVPVRIHSAERAVRRGHEALLVQWARAAKQQLQLALWVEGQRSLLCLGLAGWLLYSHIQAVGISGSLLLLSYWVLKLPSLGERLAALSLQYPSLRNIAVRALEPINYLENAPAPAVFAASVAVDASAAEHEMPCVKMPGVAVVMRDVQLKVAGHTLLEAVNLAVASGEHIAIVGPSGAGKSSLFGLLLGWYQVAGGELRIDGEGMGPAVLQTLRQETAWVDPAIQLWNRSLLENLRYSPSALPPAEWISILEKADLNGVLAHLPDGLQSNLGEGGARLSGGEGQRVRLARAMGQQSPRLVLLDEPFRGLDRSQRHHHLQQCREHWRHSTLLCITHDIEETSTFDRVWVIEGGLLIEDGTPQALAADASSRYRQLRESEQLLASSLWAAPFWRRMRVENGQLQERQVHGA